MAKSDRTEYAGHFRPFQAVLGDADARYEGTAIRLPLRLDASESTIKSTPTDIDIARKMFLDFLKNDLAESMLFLKHITNVILVEIASDGSRRTLGRAWIDNADEVKSLRCRNRGREAEMSHHNLVVSVDIEGVVSTQKWLITNFVEDYSAAGGLLETRLRRRSGSLTPMMATEKLLPHVALAIPLEQHAGTLAFRGRLFTLLPLPIFTGFPLHVNAVLALTSSRQNLRNISDASPGSREQVLVEWNKIVLSELTPKAWAGAFIHMAAQKSSDMLALWPPFPSSNGGDAVYWKDLPVRLLELSGSELVWPLARPPNGLYSPLSELVVVDQASGIPLDALSACNISLIVPPVNVLSLIKRSNTFKKVVASPELLHPHLKVRANSVHRDDSLTSDPFAS